MAMAHFAGLRDFAYGKTILIQQLKSFYLLDGDLALPVFGVTFYFLREEYFKLF